MNIELGATLIKNEIVPLLKVFYPFEIFETGQDEQPTYRLHINETDIQVAYFNGVETNQVIKRIANIEGINLLEGKARKRRLKQALKVILYDLCSKVTGIRPEWGILTGIRPTKLAFNLFRDLKDLALVKKTLVSFYRLSEAKANLLIQVIQQEGPYMSTQGSFTSVYIGIPFCPSRCSYCTFTSYLPEKWMSAYESYVDVLIDEITPFKEAFKTCQSVYIGGGTPTALMPQDLERLLNVVRRYLGDRTIEFTVEAGRPDAISYGKLAIMKKYGVNRISINPQTMEDQTLRTVGRKHNAMDVKTCFYMARDLGFDSINMDMIIGLPGETSKEVSRTLEALTAMGPENITVHTLAFKRGSTLTKAAEDGLLSMAKDIETSLALAATSMSGNGYVPYYLYRQKNMIGNYENIGYTKPNAAGIYNMAIMEETDHILAFGAGAISKKVSCDGIERLDQPKDVVTYLNKIETIIEKKKDFFSDVYMTPTGQ